MTHQHGYRSYNHKTDPLERDPSLERYPEEDEAFPMERSEIARRKQEEWQQAGEYNEWIKDVTS